MINVNRAQRKLFQKVLRSTMVEPDICQRFANSFLFGFQTPLFFLFDAYKMRVDTVSSVFCKKMSVSTADFDFYFRAACDLVENVRKVSTDYGITCQSVYQFLFLLFFSRDIHNEPFSLKISA